EQKCTNGDDRNHQLLATRDAGNRNQNIDTGANAVPPSKCSATALESQPDADDMLHLHCIGKRWRIALRNCWSSLWFSGRFLPHLAVSNQKVRENGHLPAGRSA
ncbi:hypothetical protein, partial [Pectobacterium cacticida]|uniref:hypothetical protein n=1 Tax=Pectobacterium cacticida TaxID=69221 RepID=UPI0035E481A6